MRRRSRRRPVIAAILALAGVLLLPSVATADTCCANIRIEISPRSAVPGDTVRLIGMECRAADNSGLLELKLGAFWLWPGTRAGAPDPATVPGEAFPADLPPTEQWLPFASVPPAGARTGDATIVVPRVRRGTYQLWWWCDDGSGPGGAIHFSTGPRLAVGGPPDTGTAPAPGRSAGKSRGTSAPGSLRRPA